MLPRPADNIPCKADIYDPIFSLEKKFATCILKRQATIKLAKMSSEELAYF